MDGYSASWNTESEIHVPWEVFHRIMARFPLQRPKLYLPHRELQAIAAL
jgi:hypothetical protein